MSELSDLEFHLLALLGAEELSGRDLASAYAKETGGTIAYGTLYTTLRRLREAGLAESRDDEDADGRVRFFTLTLSGRHAVQRARRELMRMASFGQLRGEVA